MRVAICDDDMVCGAQLEKILKTNHPQILYQIFLRPEELLDAMEHGQTFDVVCMDIEWKEARNGIDFASELVGLAPLTQIIFMTGYNDRFSQ